MFINNSNLDFEKPYTFYYDETNNIRVFSLKEKGFNTDINRNFILGGIAIEQEREIGDIKRRIKNLGLNNGNSEIKINDFCRNKASIFNCLKQSKTQKLLKFLLDEKIYIHYVYHDNLFYSLADIIDSVDKHNEFPWSAYNSFLKTELYRQFKYNLTEMINLLQEYNYPNVGEESAEFYKKLVVLITRNVECEMPHVRKETELLLDYLNQFKEEAIYLSNNKNKIERKRSILIDEYYLLYTRRGCDFRSSNHIFDEELEVEKKLKTGKVIFPNMKFIDSKSNILIQISDVVVGMLGRLFKWINEEDREYFQLERIIKDLDEKSATGFGMFKELMRDSNMENGAFLNRSTNRDFSSKLNRLIYT